MNILLNSGWIKSLIAKGIKFGINKKAGIKADFDIHDLKVSDDEEGVRLHLDIDVIMDRDELERVLKNLM